MADEYLDYRYPEGSYQDPSPQNMSNMQRFLQEDETCLSRRLVQDVPQPHFDGANLSATAAGHYGASNPWRLDISIAQGVYPQEGWARDWQTSDHESCSATTGNTWSPRASESCPDPDPRYSWPEPHVYGERYGYPDYGPSFAHGAGVSTPQSITGALSEIQQCPGNQTEVARVEEELHLPYRGSPNTTTQLNNSTVNLPRPKGLGSPVNESAVASPVSQGDDVAMESVSGDGDGDGSDYIPQSRSKRTSRNQKTRTRSHTKGSSSPIAKRSSMSKSDPHQLTAPAKITKRTSSASKPGIPTTSSHPQHVTKQTSHANDVLCSYCPSSFPSASTLQKHVLSAHTRPFVCSFRRYGCTSRFGSKNEWKRHVSSQHLCPGIYRCDIGGCIPRPAPKSPPSSRSHAHLNDSHARPAEEHQQATDHSPNDFNRKDLFTQHLRRMHRPGASASRPTKDAFDSGLEAIRQRCWIPLRDSPPKSTCPYCAPHPSRPSAPNNSPHSTNQVYRPVVFEGMGSWDERMEH
ncbi:MAG: hypothetical protein L6R39_002432, partial [Caloplaca ligustica]